METHYGEVYRALYERHWWWRSRERLILAELARLRPEGRWEAILDVGCGDGLFFAQLSRLSDVVEGVERDPTVLGDAAPLQREHGRIHPVAFDAGFQPGRRYDLILMLDVLEHLDQPQAAVNRALELLLPGGILFVTVPALNLLFTQHDLLNQHRRRYSRRALRRLLPPQLELLELRYFFHWLFPLKLAVRAKETLLRRGRPQPPAIPPAPLNETFRALSEAEHRWLRPLSLPWGSSLLLIARKRAGRG